MSIEVYKTTDISDKSWEEITSGFNRAFKQNKDPLSLKEYYLSNPSGYSIHGLVKTSNGLIYGHTSVIPYEYRVHKTNTVLGLSGGTFILKENRSEEYILEDLYLEIKKYCKKIGISAIIGVPNNLSYNYFIKYLGFNYIMDLDYYILPVRIFNLLLRKSRIGDTIYLLPLFLFLVLNKLYSLISNTKEIKRPIQLQLSDSFIKLRFSSNYKSYYSKTSNGIYRISKEEGIDVAYIFSFTEDNEMTLKALISTISHIIRYEKVDVIAYIGTMPFPQRILFKLPASKVPKKFPLVFDMIENNSALFEEFQSPQNWSFSLIIFDVR